VGTAIHTARRELKVLCQYWADKNKTAKEVARFDLCAALVRRLDIAERELLELTEMSELK
jgi:hypothetical protein